jgi:hypothetical protein
VEENLPVFTILLNVCMYLTAENDINEIFPFIMQEEKKSATGESNETKSHSGDEYDDGLC